MESWLPALVLLVSFFTLLSISIPIVYAIAIASLLSVLLLIPFESSLLVITQKMAFGLDSFALLAIPFFVLAGNLMNSGGIARRLINLALSLVGWVPGSLAVCNVLANALFGAISGSAVASAAAVGGAMNERQRALGYDPNFSAAVNIASAPAGLMIPPSNVLIVYSLASGGTSIAALFLAGYLPGILMAFGLMFMSSCMVMMGKKKIPRLPFSLTQCLTAFIDAIPSLLLIIIIIGGIIKGVYTATEASAIAVIYSLLLSMVIYKEIKIKDLYKIILDSVITSTSVLLLVGASLGMSWVMTNADIPFLIEEGMNGIRDNPLLVLLVINLILLVVGTFMDIVPAILIFTPIFLPFAQALGFHPVHFGIMMVFNLSIGLCTPPVGTVLFVGASVGGVKIENVIKPLLPLYGVLLIVLALITIFPSISLVIPEWLGKI